LFDFFYLIFHWLIVAFERVFELKRKGIENRHGFDRIVKTMERTEDGDIPKRGEAIAGKLI